MTTKRSPLLTIFLVVFFDLLSFGIVIPILPYYAKEFGASGVELGWLMASYSGAQFLFAPFWGSLSDRIGRRPVLLATICAGALAMLGTALAGSYWLLFLCRFLAGAFAANISTASAYISDITTDENRAKGMGAIGAGFGLGFIFGPAVGGVLSAHGYSTPILLAAAIGGMNLIFAFFFLHEPARNLVPQSRSRIAGLAEALASPKTALPIALFFLHTLAFSQLEMSFGLYVLEKFGLSARGAGAFLAGMGIASAALQGGLIGRLTRRFGEISLVNAAFAVFTAGIAASAFAPTPALFAACLLAVSIGMGMSNPCLSSLVSKGARPEQRGLIMGVYQSAGSLARILGPLLAGVLFDRVSSASPMLCSSLLVLLAFLLSLRARGSLR